MGLLHYEIFERRTSGLSSDVPQRLVGSGTITTSGTISAAVSAPAISHRLERELVLMLVASAAANIYVHVLESGSPSGAGTHANPDTQPRLLVRNSDGRVGVLLPEGGSFAAVDAAAFT